ncbi:MAG: YqaA family protein [Planctomycetota bacterium]
MTEPVKKGPIHRVYDWLLGLAERRSGTRALALLAFAESSFFPIPPDPLLLALCLGRRERSLRFGMVATLASVAGGLFGYWIGWALWGSLEDRFYAWIPGFTPEGFERIHGLYDEYGVFIVFLAGFSPIPYKLFTVASGVMGLDILAFTGASLVGRGARFLLVAELARRFGPPVRAFLERHLVRLSWAFAILAVLGFAAVKWLA